MATTPMHLTLARAYDLAPGIHYRVLARPLDEPDGAPARPDRQLGTIELNRQVALSDGQVHAIVRRGGLFSGRLELLAGREPVAGEPPLAVYLRQRQGLRRRHLLLVHGPSEGRYWLRRRSWLGSPANVDVVALPADGGADSRAADGILAQVEKSGTWRRRLQARWLAPGELALPVMLFVLNVLADLDRRAAAAASAGASGV